MNNAIRVFSALAIMFLPLTVSLAAFAQVQVQEGYADDHVSPDVQVDRSVLEDLKGYQPPPMFGAAPADSVVVTPAPLKAAPPVAPTLTTPKPEDILSHPIENHHVLTEQHPPMTAPSAPAAPAAPVKSTSAKKIKTAPVKSAVKKTEIKKSEIKSETKKSSRPQIIKNMPAVPSVSVEKTVLPPLSSSALPALPPTTDNMMEHKKPSIGEKMMDAALQRHIETDDAKIKEKLQEQPVKNVIPKPAAITPATSAPTASSNHSLIFKNGQTALDKNLESELLKNIIPSLVKPFAKDTAARIQILSFASSLDGTESSARRISLSRALAVRDYMLAHKISPDRIDVRALAGGGTGDKGTSSAPDRIDVVLLK